MPISAESSVFQNSRETSSISDGAVSVFSGHVHRVQVPQGEAWVRAIKEKLDQLTALPKGWDGYGGIPVSFSTAHFALQVLERIYDERLGIPDLVPGADGSVQMEWHLNGYDLEIDVLRATEVEAYLQDIESGKDHELSLDTDFTEIAQWVRVVSDTNERAGAEAA